MSQQRRDDEVSDAVVAVHSTVPDEALTATVLGTERSGSGTCIGAGGLILTVGYLVLEAESVWITTTAGRAAPGDVIAQDQETGLALVRALQPLEVEALELGAGAALQIADPVTVCGFGEEPIEARLVARQEFAGYWEYVLDEALFTAPAHPNWGGAALIGADGALCAVGSLLVQVQDGTEAASANMMVPVDPLKPVLGELVAHGRRPGPVRPWLGMFVQPGEEHLTVAGVYEGCPAARAGLRPGDLVLEVAGEPVSEIAALFRRIWALGPAGVDVPLTVESEHAVPRTVRVASVDRGQCLHRRPLH